MNLKKQRYFKAATALLATIGLVTGLSACTTTEKSSPSIVVTTDILGDVVSNIVGDDSKILTLMPAGSDPHSFQISAKTAAEIEQSQLIIYSGLGLEEGVLSLVNQAAKSGITSFEVGNAIGPIPYADGENAGQLDPHFWSDPSKMIIAVDALVPVILESVPNLDDATVKANAENYKAELTELDKWMGKQLATVPSNNRNLVTNHNVFAYLAKHYGYTVLGAIVPSGTSLASPSAQDLESLANAIREAGVPAIFIDTAQPTKLADALAGEIGAEVTIVKLYTESLGTAGSYLEMMRSNTEKIVAFLTTAR